MRKAMLNQIHGIINSMNEIHYLIKKRLVKNDIGQVAAALEDCQDAAIAIGTNIDKAEGEGTRTVKLLEEYCELVYNIHEEVLSGKDVSSSNVFKRLNKSLNDIKAMIADEIHVKREVVFLPYKASMWDSLESVWKKADADPECTASVIPIPYYDKNPDGSVREFHYEGNQYPEDVPIVNFQEYDFEGKHPDEIYIHNPYDDCNYVTSVHPFFYSKNLKKFTDKLVYIPYFVLEDPDPNNQTSVESVAHFAQTPGVIYADEVRVQSENMRLCYIQAMVQLYGEGSRKTWEQKIIASESPKFEKVKNTRRQDVNVPQEWAEKIKNADGTDKKVILYNTSVGALLQEDEKMIDKIESVLKIFYENKDRVTLLWRPHPLIQATISSMRPQLWNRYAAIVEKYKEEGWGIYDDSSDLDRAIVISDAYYGDASSVVQLCREVGMPIMIQNVNC